MGSIKLKEFSKAMNEIELSFNKSIMLKKINKTKSITQIKY